MTNVVIASAARTAVGSFGGAFANTPAHDLGAAILSEVVTRAGVDKSEVSETILGQVLTAGQGQNPARQAHINAGLPQESSAWSINQVCGSGLRAIALAAQHIQLGDASIVAAGGQENMTMSPHVANLRAGTKMGDVSYIDSMIRDGLWDAFNGYHMGTTAENVAKQWQISRDQQDEFAVASQNKAEAAQKAGKFADEIAAFTVKTRKGETIVDQDEYIRHGATMEAMGKLRPAFDREGSVTAANASGLNDGAAALVLASATAFTVLKWVGAAYLVYLGVKLLLSAKEEGLSLPSASRSVTPRSVFKHAAAVTALNPKSIAFFIAFVPQFIRPEAAFLPQVGVLIVTFVTLATLNALAYALLADRLRSLISQPKALVWMTRAGGATLVAMGLFTATLKRATP